MLTIKIPKRLFWDLDLSKIDEIQNRLIIIERVFSMGDIPDIRELIKFYGKNTIKKEIKKAGNLDNKTLAWASIFLNIPKSDFKCYSKRQSNQAHWSY
jgi:hypothetical protein